jgi:hypothetical protein
MTEADNEPAALDPGGASPLGVNRKSHGRWRLFVGGLLLVLGGAWAANYLLIGRPVARELDSDTRNAGYSLRAHYRYYVDPTTLVLDLSDVQSAAPVDLLRGVFQSAKALHASGRKFERVILARSRTPIFLMTGDNFSSIGAEFSAGQNPVYLIRTFPEKLQRLDGTAAFGRWEGGWLGVVGKQMEDVNKAAREWSGDH